MSKIKTVKRTRDPEKTRATILQVAFMEIFRNGFQGVSVDDMVAKTGLTKGAFFHHFPTKLSLGYANVDETLKRMTFERWIQPLEAYENPLEGILQVLKTRIDEAGEFLSLGCPLNNLIQEMSSVDAVFRKKLQTVLTFWIDGVETHLKRAKKGGYLREDIQVRRLAEFIVMAHEGAYGMTKSYGDRKIFLSLHSSLKSYLSSLTE
jgi:TetR/AcrR family transcriptional repressor of nem operon